MSTRLKIALWTLAVCAAVSVEAIWFPLPSVPPRDVAAFLKLSEQTLRGAVERKQLGCAGLVLIQGHQVVAEQNFGPETVTANSLYQVASVSKAVTAWGVMKLVEEKRIGLDDPVMRHLKRWRFPGSESFRDRVTVRQLLTHTAGLDDGLGYGGFLPGQEVQTLEASLLLTKDSTVGEPKPVRITQEPGTGFAYSGGSYAVLQMLMEDVTQRTFNDYMRDTVLRPLGMHNATFDNAPSAPNYDAELREQPQRRYAAPAAVGLRVSPRDLAKFAIAMAGANSVLTQSTLNAMFQPQPAAASWGIGHRLYVQNSIGGYVVGHDGGTLPAWGASVRVNPATGNGIVIVTSGGRNALSGLPNAWTYWETGNVPQQAHLDKVYRRAPYAAGAILCGTFAILWLRRRKL